MTSRFGSCGAGITDYDVTAECRVATAILLDRIQKHSTQTVQAVMIVPKLAIRENTLHK